MADVVDLPIDLSPAGYEVLAFRPGSLDITGPNRLSAVRYSRLAIALAGAIREVHQRTLRDTGAETLAKALAARIGTFYIVREPGAYGEGIVGYAYTEPPGTDAAVLRISELEAFNADQGQRACREVASTAVYGAMLDNPGPDRLRIDARAVIPEGRSEDYFVHDLGMELPPGVSWEDPGAYVMGPRDSVIEHITSNFAVEE